MTSSNSEEVVHALDSFPEAVCRRQGDVGSDTPSVEEGAAKLGLGHHLGLHDGVRVRHDEHSLFLEIPLGERLELGRLPECHARDAEDRFSPREHGICLDATLDHEEDAAGREQQRNRIRVHVEPARDSMLAVFGLAGVLVRSSYGDAVMCLLNVARQALRMPRIPGCRGMVVRPALLHGGVGAERVLRFIWMGVNVLNVGARVSTGTSGRISG